VLKRKILPHRLSNLYIARKPQVNASADTKEREIGMGHGVCYVLVLKGYDGQSAAYMCRLVFYTPLLYGVLDLGTVELDLGVIARLKGGFGKVARKVS